MNHQQKVVQARELMQQISDNGGIQYEPDTFHYDREIGWEVHTDEAPEIAWHDFSYRSHESGLMVYRNLNEVIRYLRAELKSLRIQKHATTDENMMWAGDEQGYVFVEE